MANSITVSVVKKPEISDALKARVKQKIITARIALLFNHPFYGVLAIRLELCPADAWCKTLATDGVRLYYNHEFVDKLTQKEVEFGFGHELLHVVYDHMARRNGRDKDLFNVACDYAVNLDLVDNNVGKKITTVPILYDTKYRGLCAEEIYNLLEKEMKKQGNQSGQGKNGRGNGKGSGQSNQSGNGQSGTGTLDDLLDKIFDQHLDPKDPADNGSGNSKNGQSQDGSTGPVPMTDEERKILRDELREAIINAASQDTAGNLPAGVKRILHELTDPQMDWRELLQMHLDGTINKDYTWMKPTRYDLGIEAILPGMTVDQALDICVAIDVSGSISEDQARDFLSEVKGIMSQFDDYKIHVWCFDTQIYNPKIFTSDNLEDIDSYEILGGGGTMFECNYEYMKKEDIAPKRFIMFTDGYPCGSWGDEQYCDTLFVIHGNKTIVPPYGMVAYYEFNKNK